MAPMRPHALRPPEPPCSTHATAAVLATGGGGIATLSSLACFTAVFAPILGGASVVAFFFFFFFNKPEYSLISLDRHRSTASKAAPIGEVTHQQ